MNVSLALRVILIPATLAMLTQASAELLGAGAGGVGAGSGGGDGESRLAFVLLWLLWAMAIQVGSLVVKDVSERVVASTEARWGPRLDRLDVRLDEDERIATMRAELAAERIVRAAAEREARAARADRDARVREAGEMGAMTMADLAGLHSANGVNREHGGVDMEPDA